MTVNILPFSEAMLPAAGQLLAQRHQRHCAVLPELPARFAVAKIATKAVEVLWQKEFKSGFAAFRENQLIAYLIGETTVQSWGRCGYVYLPGYGLAQGERPEIVQDLYALLGEEWNQRGCFQHYSYLSVADVDLLEAWFALGFGKERVEALLDVRAIKIPQIENPSGIEIRRVAKGDNDYLVSLSDTIGKHQNQAPRWHPRLPEDAPAQRAGWAEIADTEAVLAFLALQGQEAVGTLAFYVEDETDDDLTVPPRCRYLAVAATQASARGRGIGQALAWRGLALLREEGAAYCLTNWQSANLLAARFWPRFGFKPVAYRLARMINPMIAWAKG